MPKFKFLTLSLLSLSVCGQTFAQSRLDHRHVEICRYVPKFGIDKLTQTMEFMPRTANRDFIVFGNDTLKVHRMVRGQSLSETDYREVAALLKVEVAAIKAVVEIETGNTHSGFNKDLTPILNFNTEVFKTMAGRHSIQLEKYLKSHPLVFESPDSSLFDNYQDAQYKRLHSAMAIDTVAAIEGAFWGMFQIGGFNWRKCGTSSVREFMEIMSGTERDQLDLFAKFLKSTGLLAYLQKKDWETFARRYNGPSYENYNYHTRLAAAYERFSAAE